MKSSPNQLSLFAPTPPVPGIALTAAEAEDIRARDAAVMTWLKERSKIKSGGFSYRVGEPEAAGLQPPTNEERSALEVYDWVTSPPEKYFAYVNPHPDIWRSENRRRYFLNGEKPREIATWMGDVLGTITWVGSPWADNFGGRRVAITVKGTNGIEYTGTYYASSGDFCRLRAVKSSWHLYQSVKDAVAKVCDGSNESGERCGCDVCDECGFHNDHSLSCRTGQQKG